MIIVYSHGRMGNQYFQYAFARNLQIELQKKYNKYHEIKFIFGVEGDLLKHTNAKYEKLNIKVKIWPKIYILLNIIGDLIFKGNKIKKFDSSVNKLLNFFGIYYNNIDYFDYKIKNRKKYIIDGYFQSELFFKNNSEIIKKELKNKTNNKYENKNSVCIHIRRGDYLNDIYHNRFLVCTKQYYINAINEMKKKNKNNKLYIFSDDIEWVKKEFDMPKNTFYENYNKSYIDNFEIMYNCENFVLSNSSFSWWACYLADAHHVIAPNRWRNDVNVVDIYLDEWIRLKGDVV